MEGRGSGGSEEKERDERNAFRCWAQSYRCGDFKSGITYGDMNDASGAELAGQLALQAS